MTMDETTLKKKVANSFLAGIVGNAVAAPQGKVSTGMRYQCLILQAWFAAGRFPDPESLTDFILKNTPSQAFIDIVRRAGRESVFPVDKPWDASCGWAYAFWPDEVRLGGRLAAAAVAEALQPQSSLQKVIVASLDACSRHGIEGAILRERLEAAVQLANRCGSTGEFKQDFYEKFQIPLANSLLEVIPLALACVILGKGKPYASIWAAIDVGRNVDQTAALAGQIAGALEAVSDLPSETTDQIVQKNPEIPIKKISELLEKFVVEQYRRAVSVRKSVLELLQKRAGDPLVAVDSGDLLFDKYLGFLIGGSCGDAMGCPVEWQHFEDIHAQWGWVDRFVDFARQDHRPHGFYEGPTLFGPITEYDTTKINTLGAWDLSKGTYSDDMRFRLLLCCAMLEKGEAVTGSEFADYLIRYRLQDLTGEQGSLPSWEGPQREWAEQLASGVMLEALYGRRQPVGHCSTWDGPVGLIYPADEELASRHGYLMAACIAHAFHPGATVASLVECACAHTSSYGEEEFSQELHDRIRGAVELARKSESVDQFYREFYDRFLVPQPSWQIFILEQIPATLALLTFGENDPKQAILAAVNFGRDTDTIACMVGELAGTLFGASALPPDWVAAILAANPKPDLPDIASRFRKIALKRAGKPQ